MKWMGALLLYRLEVGQEELKARESLGRKSEIVKFVLLLGWREVLDGLDGFDSLWTYVCKEPKGQSKKNHSSPLLQGSLDFVCLSAL